MIFRTALAIAASVAIVCGACADVYTNEKTLIEGLSFQFLKQGDSVTYNIDLPAGKPVVGFRFEGDYTDDGPGAPTFWASDLQLKITSPNGRMWTVGGFFSPRDEDWAFQGPGSDGDGHYGDDGEDIFLPWLDDPLASGVFNVAFSNDWQSDPNENLYDVQVRFYQATPAPGALALLGLAGLVGRGRRRSR